MSSPTSTRGQGPSTPSPSPADARLAASVAERMAAHASMTITPAELAACRAAGMLGGARDPVVERERLLERAGIPALFRSVAPERGYEGLVSSGGALLLAGPVGTGKTRLACAVALDSVGRREVRFTSSAALMGAMSSTFGTGRTPDSVLAPYLACALLVLDDLGKEPADDRTLARLFQLVDGRYSRRAATVVTSQFGPAELAARLARHGDRETAEAIASRLSPARGWCAVQRTSSPMPGERGRGGDASAGRG